MRPAGAAPRRTTHAFATNPICEAVGAVAQPVGAGGKPNRFGPLNTPGRTKLGGRPWRTQIFQDTKNMGHVPFSDNPFSHSRRTHPGFTPNDGELERNRLRRPQPTRRRTGSKIRRHIQTFDPLGMPPNWKLDPHQPQFRDTTEVPRLSDSEYGPSRIDV